MGTKGQMFGAWAGATLGGYFGSGLANLFFSDPLAAPVAFGAGAVLGMFGGELATSPSVAAGIKGIILGTKHALSATGGGIAGLYVARSVQMEMITVLPELTLAAICAAVSVILFEVLV